MTRHATYFLLALLLIPTAQALGLDTDSFSIDLGANGKLMRENASERERQYTLANPDEKLLVLVKVLSFRKSKDAAQFRDRLIAALRQDAAKRGDKVVDERNDVHDRCDQRSIGYTKPARNSTNVDFYLLCKKQVIVANYAIQGTDEKHIQTARATQKTFKLR